MIGFLYFPQASQMILSVLLFTFVAIAIGLFIYSGLKLEEYRFIEFGVHMPTSTYAAIQRKNEEFRSTFNISLIIGIFLILFSAVPLIVLSDLGKGLGNLGIVILLAMVALAVYIFIYNGMVKDGYNKLLKSPYTSKREKEQNRVMAAFSTILCHLRLLYFL